jgi:hypothetical protein
MLEKGKRSTLLAKRFISKLSRFQAEANFLTNTIFLAINSFLLNTIELWPKTPAYGQTL